MIDTLKEELWHQFGASLDMLRNAIEKCPEEIWGELTFEGNQFWYIAYHTLFYIDCYSDEDPKNFHPPQPYNLSEYEYDTLPERVFTKNELLDYENHCREKSRKLIASLTEEKAKKRWINEWKNYSYIEIIIYNMRHIQHHTGQLNMMIGKINKKLPIWVSQTKERLE